MNYKIFVAVLSLLLALGLCACATTQQGVKSGEPSAKSSQNSGEPSAAVSSDKTLPPATPQPVTFPTPDVPYDILAQDMCILSYLNALKNNDADGVIRISTSKIIGDIYAGYFGSDFLGELYSISQTSDLMKNTSMFIYSILSDVDPSQAVPEYSDELIEGFIQEVDPIRLKDIEILAFGTPLENPKLNVPSSLQVDISVFSCRYCLLSIDGNTYYQLFWLMSSDNGYRLALVGDYDKLFNGISKQISREDFIGLIDLETVVVPTDDMQGTSADISSEPTYLQKIKEAPFPSIKDPAKAISLFTESLAGKDVYSALSAFAVKENADNFDLHVATERMHAFMPCSYGMLTPEYAFYRDINLAVSCCNRAADILLLLPAFSYDYSKLKDTEFSPDFVFSAMQNTCDNISSLSLIRSDVIADSVEGNRLEINKRQASTYGGDIFEHRIVEFKLGKKAYVSGMNLISYAGEWRIQEYSTVFLNLPPSFPVAPSSMLDYDSYI